MSILPEPQQPRSSSRLARTIRWLIFLVVALFLVSHFLVKNPTGGVELSAAGFGATLPETSSVAAVPEPSAVAPPEAAPSAVAPPTELLETEMPTMRIPTELSLPTSELTLDTSISLPIPLTSSSSETPTSTNSTPTSSSVPPPLTSSSPTSSELRATVPPPIVYDSTTFRPESLTVDPGTRLEWENLSTQDCTVVFSETLGLDRSGESFTLNAGERATWTPSKPDTFYNYWCDGQDSAVGGLILTGHSL